MKEYRGVQAIGSVNLLPKSISDFQLQTTKKKASERVCRFIITAGRKFLTVDRQHQVQRDVTESQRIAQPEGVKPIAKSYSRGNHSSARTEYSSADAYKSFD